MFGQSAVMRAIRLGQSVRYFRSNASLRDAKTVSAPVVDTVLKGATPKAPRTLDTEEVLGAKMHKCSDFEKWMLVWLRKYPQIDQVPEKISVELLHKAQSQARVRLCNWMMVFTVLGCVGAVIAGKRQAQTGNTLAHQNQEWHDRINREYKDSIAAQQKTT